MSRAENSVFPALLWARPGQRPGEHRGAGDRSHPSNSGRRVLNGLTRTTGRAKSAPRLPALRMPDRVGRESNLHPTREYESNRPHFLTMQRDTNSPHTNDRPSPMSHVLTRAARPLARTAQLSMSSPMPSRNDSYAVVRPSPPVCISGLSIPRNVR
jgi:hypothetical protein